MFLGFWSAWKGFCAWFWFEKWMCPSIQVTSIADIQHMSRKAFYIFVKEKKYERIGF